jgi:hypothetical protein
MRASRVRASAARSRAFIFENASSMGLRSGECRAAGTQKRTAPLLDELAHPRTFVRRKIVHHHHHLPGLERGCQNALQVGFEDLPGGRALDRQARAHPSHALMLAKSVTLAPQLRGAEQSARSPLGDQA